MMSVTSPPPVASSASAEGPRRAKSDELIETRIEEACRALWWAELVRTILRLIVFSITALMLWVVMDQWIYSPGRAVRLVAFVGVAALLGTYLYRRVRPLIGNSIHPEYAARSLEHDMPELRQSLTSYVTLRKDRDAGTLRSRVVKSIGSSTAKQLKRHDALPVEATGTLRWWVAATCALVILLAYAAFSPKDTLQSAARLAAPVASIEPPRRVSIKEVEPGDSDAIAGRGVKISASIRGLRGGEEAFCYWDLPTGRQELPLTYDEDQRKHIGELQLPHSSSGMVPYVISAGDSSSRRYRLTVQDVPVVALESVEYTPPKYTGQAPFTSRSGAIAAVDGTTVKILASTNRPVAKAKIEFNPRRLGNRVQATAGATELQIDDSGKSLAVSFPLRSRRGQSAAVELEDYRIVVADSSGQQNPEPIIYPIRVISDLPPEVSITVPASSPKEVPINAQQVIEVHASDPDYGLQAVSLEIRSGIDLIDEPVLWQSEMGEKGHRVAEFALRPADLDLRIGDTVEVVAVATDNRSSDTDSNVEPNVVRTDPVTIRITATGLLPDESDPNADGLSEPEESSSKDESSSGDKGGDSGEQQSGGGGSGEGGKKQEGGDQGEGGSSGQGSGGDSGDDQSSGGGSGGESDPSDSNDDESGSDDAGGSEGSDSESGEGDSEGDISSGDGNEGDEGGGETPQSAADPSDSNDPDGGDESGGSQSEGENEGPSGQSPQDGSGGSSESGSQEGAEGNQGADSSGDSGDSGSSGSESGSSGESQGSQGDDSGSSGADSQAGSESEGGSGAQGESGAKEAPKHDGEAFERIKEYMEKKAQQQSGDNQSASQEQGEQQTGSDDQQSGQQGQSSNGSKKGDPSSSSPQSDSSSAQSDGSSGDQSSGDQSSGDQSSGDQTAGEQSGSSDDQQSSDSSDGGSNAQEDSADGAGQSGSPQESGEQGSGESGGSDQGTGESGSSEAASGEQGGTENEQGGEGSGSSEPSPASESSDSAGDQTQAGSDDGSADGTEGQPSAAKPGDPESTNTTASSSSGGSEGDMGDVGSVDDQPPPPPDPVNVDYAKKATDLVLDYLDQNREAPDPKLLEDLQWSKEDLQRFSDRWSDIRDMSKQPGMEGNSEMEEALKSLGLRPKNVTSRSVQETGDTLGGIRDSGNRKPPPPAFRDAFDAFRRAVGQGK